MFIVLSCRGHNGVAFWRW